MLSIIQIGHNEASERYIRNKVKAIKAAGLQAEVINLPQTSTTTDVLSAINKGASAVMVQLPLPSHIDKDKVLKAIPVDKDIDGLNPHSQYKPLTPCGIMRWLKEQNIELEGKTVAILGRSDLVGKPLADMMISAGATVSVLNSKTPERIRKMLCREANIIVSAVGKSNTVHHDYVNTGYPKVVIDVGINHDEDGKLCGDVGKMAREIIETNHGICTPVPGGVGKWTVRELVLRLKEVEQ